MPVSAIFRIEYILFFLLGEFSVIYASMVVLFYLDSHCCGIDRYGVTVENKAFSFFYYYCFTLCI